ncbi:MAG: SMP-30/gluconolactonase/LRE family protein [Deltaproteobacteria bacterium]|jgi:gluconolactonase|nr:SMP-30/gluconolactonase/LRE family protein [Deltaproteobacteria bacterium]
MAKFKSSVIVTVLAGLAFWVGPALAQDLVPDGVFYKVKPGDTLESLAATWLGDPGQAPRIAEATRAAASGDPALARLDGGELKPGETLLLPVKLTTRDKGEFLIDKGLDFPEAPFWSDRDQALYYVEWAGDKVWRLKDGQKTLFIENAKGDGPCGLDQDGEGNFWMALYSSGQVALYSPEGERLKSYGEGPAGPFVGPNDLVLDRKGGVYFTDSGNFEDDWVSGREAGKLYYIAPDGRLLLLDENISYANGVALSPDGTRLFVNEHRKNRILVYDVAADGQVGNRRVLVDLDGDCLSDQEVCYEVGPDGMTRDAEGNLWVAHYHAGAMLKIGPEGQLLQKLFLPLGDTPTNASLSPDGKSLYISEASQGLLLLVPTE